MYYCAKRKLMYFDGLCKLSKNQKWNVDGAIYGTMWNVLTKCRKMWMTMLNWRKMTFQIDGNKKNCRTLKLCKTVIGWFMDVRLSTSKLLSGTTPSNTSPYPCSYSRGKQFKTDSKFEDLYYVRRQLSMKYDYRMMWMVRIIGYK